MKVRTWDIISQVVIATLGISAIFLVGDKNPWGFVLGFATQPFWYITSYIHRQWGIFFLSIGYTIMWVKGIYQWFF